MKEFLTYINEKQMIYEFSNNEILTEGILKKLADWLGGGSASLYNKVNNFYDELYNLPDNILKAFNGAIACSSPKVKFKSDISDDEKQKTIETILDGGKDKMLENIVKIAKEHGDDEEYQKDPMYVSLYVAGINYAREKKDSESEKILLDAFNKVSDDVKKQALQIQKETPLPDDGKDNNNDDKTVDDKKVDDIVDDVIDDIDDKEKQKKLDDISQKIHDKIVKILKENGQKFKHLDIYNFAEELAKYFIGEIELKDCKLINDESLNKYLIKDLEKFKEEILSEIK